MPDLVSQSSHGDVDKVVVIAIENPPVNALSPGVPEGIAAGVTSAQADDSVVAIVLTGAGKTFCAGADIREFGKMVSGERERGEGFAPLLALLENCAKPIVCAIHGTAFGGGLEVAMACHYRVAVPGARVGQPEVNLGLIPGAGGTQRLPRLVGVLKAAEMCATGKPISARDAFEAGVVDLVVEGDLVEGAIEYARSRAASGEPPRKTCEIADRLVTGSADDLAAALSELRKKVGRRARGLAAPMRAIDAVEAARSMSFEDGLRAEAEIFNECLHSTQSRGMIHAFFGERTVAKIPDVPRDTPQLEIRSAAVVGAGTMGGGIAMAYADVGIPVTLKEIDAASLERGLDTIRRNYEVSLSKGRLTQQKVDERLALIRPTVDYEDLRDADIVVEAVFENMELKKKVFTEIDAVAKDGALLATNTSTLDVDEIASATNRPERVIGHHFFSPANVMRLLEIVRGAKTDKDVIATSMLLAKRLRKVGVLVGNCWGFVGNRMFGPYMREAQFLVEEGAKVEEVDAALCEFGMAMGPLAVGDLAGIDVGWRIRKELAKEGRIPEGMRPQPSADRLAELGRFGQKTSAGWYRYEEGSRRPIPDPEVETIIEECSRDAGIERRTIESREVVERCVYALINEGARILEDGMALRPVDIDVIYVNGYGFPAYRGGPMLYADTIGLSGVLERIRELEKAHGFWWAPAPLLERLVEEGKTFMEYAAESA